jgi:hypothetical protein
MNRTTPPIDDPELWALALGRTPDCPAPERLAAALAGELEPADREAILAHSGSCPACGAELELAARFESGDESDPEAVDRVVERLRGRAEGTVIPFPAARRRSAPTVWRWAAAALVVLAAGFAIQAARTGLGPRVEGPATAEVVRGGQIEASEPSGEVAGAPAQLVWQSVAGATSYRLEILDAAGDDLWSAAAAAPPLRLPAAVRAELRPHTRYSWRVIALDAAGVEMGRSAATEFFVLPAPEAGTAPPAPRS